MRIGVPRERKIGERRVALTPEQAEILCASGHQVFVEKSAGDLSGFADAQYALAGAFVVDGLAQVWGEAELLLKVKEPAPEEYPFFRKDLVVFSFLHLAAFPELTNELLKSGIIALDFDLVSKDGKRFPILEPMSAVAGKLAVQCGAYALQAGNGGSGILLGGTMGAPCGVVVVIGGGVVGRNAIAVALGMGADVTVLDINSIRLDELKQAFPRLKVAQSSSSEIAKQVTRADLVVGAVLIPGAKAPKLVTRDILKQMRPGSVLVDVCIDQGGVAETSHPTSIDEPTFVEEGVVHYCVPNIPALVPRTSTQALTQAVFPWVEELAGQGVLAALNTNSALRASLLTRNGKMTNKVVAKALGISATDSEL